MTTNELSPGWALQQSDYAAALRQVCINVSNYAARQLKAVRSTAAALLPTIVLALQASLCVAFAFAIMFIAAIIQD